MTTVSASSTATDVSPTPARARPRGRRRARHANAAGDAGVHVGAGDVHADPSLEHREQQREPAPVEPLRGAPRHRACRRPRRVPAPRRAADGALEDGRDDRPGRLRPAVGEEERRGIGHVGEAVARASRTRRARSVAPKRCLTARRKRRRVVAVAVEREDGVDRCARARAGPASAPSFVTWPTRTVGIAAVASPADERCAHSRTCATDPGALASSGSAMAWIESTASTSGASSSTCATTASSVGLASRAARSGRARRALGAEADLLRRLLRADEQAPRAARGERAERLQQQRALAHAGLAAEERDRPPATSPPPRTRSSSPMPVGRRVSAARAPRRSAPARKAPDPRPGRRGAQHPGRGGPPSRRGRPRRRTRGNARASGASSAPHSPQR